MTRFCAFVLTLALASGLVRATTIADWNEEWFDVIRATGGAPTPISRAGAMLNIAMFNAVNTTNKLYTPYYFGHAQVADAYADVAAAQAAHDVLAYLYPALSANFTARLNTQLGGVPDDAGKAKGIALGQQAAQSIIALRSADGSQGQIDDYVHGVNPGDWQETTPGSGAATPNWGDVTPFGVASASQFVPGIPFGYATMADYLASPQYTAAFNEVKSLGQDTSATRTAEQTAIAAFWANDRDGTYKPPGHLIDIAITLSQLQGLDIYEEARLMALLNIAMADAGVTAWYTKYDTDFDLWRPVTGIHEAAGDGNADTDADPAWQPLSDLINGFTPPFPAYISGHATFASTAAAIFRNFFDTETMDFTIETDDPYYNNTLGLGARTYHSFTDIAHENGESRIFLGVHWDVDFLMGYESGVGIGDYVFAYNLAPLPEPVTLIGGTMALLALGAHVAGRRSRRV